MNSIPPDRGDSHRCEVVVVARDAACLLEKSDVGALQKRDARFYGGSEGGRRLRVHGRVRECDSFLRAGLDKQVDHRGAPSRLAKSRAVRPRELFTLRSAPRSIRSLAMPTGSASETAANMRQVMSVILASALITAPESSNIL